MLTRRSLLSRALGAFAGASLVAVARYLPVRGEKFEIVDTMPPVERMKAVAIEYIDAQGVLQYERVVPGKPIGSPDNQFPIIRIWVEEPRV